MLSGFAAEFGRTPTDKQLKLWTELKEKFDGRRPSPR
jgi:hypothetical protein